METLKVNSVYHTIQPIFQRDPSLYDSIIELAWDFVTLPSPIVVCEPEVLTDQMFEREFGYWDPSPTNTEVIYLRPLVYRSYQGVQACKAWVASTRQKIPQEAVASTTWFDSIKGTAISLFGGPKE